MAEFIIKYWVQWLLGLIALGLGALAKKFYSMYKAEKERKANEEHEKLVKELSSILDEKCEEIISVNIQQQNQIDEIREGVLDLQGSSFKRFCRMLLNKDHEITVEEAQQCAKEHRAYNKLHGNSDGDLLYNMVQEKAGHNITE